MTFQTPLVCIIGAPRSGTTWLQAMVGAHPSIATAQELKVFDLFTWPWESSWRQLAELQRTAGGGPRGLRNVWSEEEFDRRLIDLLHDVYGRVLATKPGATVVLDKSPSYSKHVAHIRRLAPQVKFLHLLRDGRDVAASLRSAARGWARSWAPASIEAAAALWRDAVSDAREAKRMAPNRYLELRYEDLLAAGPESLHRIFEFIGVATTLSDAAAIHARLSFDAMKSGLGHSFELPREFFRRGESGSWRKELSARERYVFHATAGDLLVDLGYADSSWWIARPCEKWLLPAIGMVRLRRVVRRAAAAWQAAGHG